MKFELYRHDYGTTFSEVLAGLDRAGIEVEPGTTLTTAENVVTRVIERTPLTYTCRIEDDHGKRLVTYQRCLSYTAVDLDGHTVEVHTPHGRRQSYIDALVASRGGAKAPLSSDEVEHLRLAPGAEDASTTPGTWRFEDLTTPQLWSLARREYAGAC